MTDGGCPSQTAESSPVSVGYLKTDGHLEAIGADPRPTTHTRSRGRHILPVLTGGGELTGANVDLRGCRQAVRVCEKERE